MRVSSRHDFGHTLHRERWALRAESDALTEPVSVGRSKVNRSCQSEADGDEDAQGSESAALSDFESEYRCELFGVGTDRRTSAFDEVGDRGAGEEGEPEGVG